MACFLSSTDITITLPIYWVKKYKRKKDKVTLMSMNWYRNAFYFDQNNAKKYFSELVAEQVGSAKIDGQYRLSIDIYYKNPNCDGANVASMMEKFVLDALQEQDVVVNDNVKYHLGTKWAIVGKDADNPRCVVTVRGISKVMNETTD